MSKCRERIEWIDFIKGIAIVAVMIDHLSGIIYTNEHLKNASFFSVSVFIILSGITSYLNGNCETLSCYAIEVWKKCKKIVGAYLIAVLIYLIVRTHRFDLQEYVDNICFFNITGPHYFVLLYIQLMILCPLLRKIVKKATLVQNAFLLIFLMVFTWWTSNYTNILYVYGGGGKLFGGTYLVLLYFGMVLAKYDVFQFNKNLKICVLGASGISSFCFWKFFCILRDSEIGICSEINPPGIILMMYSISTIFFLYAVFEVLKNYYCFNRIANVLIYLGKNSLSIFLYHKLILDFILCKRLSFVAQMNIAIAFIVCITCMSIGSIGIQWFINVLIKKVCKMYKD